MASRKAQFKLNTEPTVYFEKNQITGTVSLSPEEIEALAPRMARIRDFMLGNGINAELSAEITIRVIDADLYTGTEDEAAS